MRDHSAAPPRWDQRDPRERYRHDIRFHTFVHVLVSYAERELIAVADLRTAAALLGKGTLRDAAEIATVLLDERAAFTREIEQESPTDAR